MDFLKIKDKRSYFIIQDEEIEPEKLSKEELFNLLNLVYENHESIVFPIDEEIETIVNPIEKEIVQQITLKIKVFHENVPSIDQEIKSGFPDFEH